MAIFAVKIAYIYTTAMKDFPTHTHDCGYAVRRLSAQDFVINHQYEVDYLGITLCVGGTASVTVNYATVDIRRGQMLFVSPGDIVCVTGMTENFMAKQICVTRMQLLLDAAAQVLPVIKDASSGRDYLVHEKVHMSEAFNAIYNFLSTILAEGYTASKYEQGVCVFRCLLLGMRDKSAEWNKEMETNTVGDSAVYFKQFMLLLGEHVKSMHDVAFYASRLNITPHYLSRICRQYGGQSAKRIINETLILRIKSTLKNTELTIKEISYEYNFPNFSAMSRFFHHHTGMTPTQFRAASRAVK